jgi:hypothetical protein
VGVVAADSYEVQLPPLRVTEGDQDEELLRAHRLGAVLLAGGGLWGALMATGERELSTWERRSALTLTLGVACAAVVGVVKPRWVARLQRRLPPPAPPLLGLAGIALTRPAVSPMFMPSLVLTAIGASTLDVRTGRRLGRLTGAGYLLLVAASSRRWQRERLWNVGMWSAYSVSGLMGAEIGRIALDVRSLERARQRDQQLVRQPGKMRRELDGAARDASAIATELERLLLDIAARDHGGDTAAVLDSIAAIRRPVHHIEMAEQLIHAAREERIDLRAGVEVMLTSFRAPVRAAGASVTLDFALSADAVYDARATLALLVTLKRSIDNAILHGEGLTRVVVTVREFEGQIVLAVEDDGAGTPAGPADWGTGLSEAANRCQQLGGGLALERGSSGIRLVAHVPAIPAQVPQNLLLERSFSARIDKVLLSIADELRTANVAQGLSCLLSGSSRRHSIAAGAVLVVMAIWDSHRAVAPTRANSIAHAAIIGSVWPRGGRPAGGWLGYKLTEHGWRTGSPLVPSAVTTLAVAIQAHRVRATVEPARIVENITFPLLCAGFGIALERAHRVLVRIDAQQLTLRQQAEYIESLAPAIEAFHDYVSPLKSDGHWWQQLSQSDRKELERLRRKLQGPTAALRALIFVTDPLAEIQAHLAVRLAPVEVTASGCQPALDETRESNRLLARARRVTELLALSDDIVDRLLDAYPPSLTGVRQLTRVHLHLEPRSGELWALWIHPITRVASESAAADLRLTRLTRSLDSFAAHPQGSDLQIELAVDAVARRAG